MQEATEAQALADDLHACLIATGGLACDLVQSVTSTTAATAERQPSVLNGLLADPQTYSHVLKNNVERFVWEFLTNRTYVGEPRLLKNDAGQDVGCDTLTYRCPDGEV